MTIAKPSKIQVNSFWISMPFITLAYVYIFYGNVMWHNWKVWVITYPLIYFIGFFSWRTHVIYDSFATKLYPALEDTKKRILVKMLVHIVVMIPSILFILYIFSHYHLAGYYRKPGDIKSAYLIGLAINVIFQTLWEVVYCIDKYSETVTEKEMLEQMNLQRQFEKLKHKVNPHFLFNCFNTLSSLISEDKQKAEAFLDELSKVYRYLLRNNEDGMATVESEIKFIESYFSLLQTRYGAGIKLSIQVKEEYNNYLLPSLTLQLLVENAVKHNIINKQLPLTVNINDAGGKRIAVTNNLNLKHVTEKSTKVGLNNISDKYKLLQLNGFEVIRDETNFTVYLPLLARPGDITDTRLNVLV